MKISYILPLLVIYCWVQTAKSRSATDAEIDGKYTGNTCARPCKQITANALCIILHSVRWHSVILFYETVYGGDVLQITLQNCPLDNLAVVQFDLSSNTHKDMNTILIDTYLKSRNGVHAIIELDEKGIELLQHVDTLDEESNKTTNFRTNSQWIIFSGKDMNRISELHLRHVLLLACQSSCVFIQTLNTDSSIGLRCLDSILNYSTSEIRLSKSHCSINDFFPNIKYKYNRQHFAIGTIESPQFFELSKDEKNNTVYFGIVVELTEVIAEILNFTFTFVLPEDGAWGVRENGKWNGMIKDIMDLKLDMIVADLSVTSDRLAVVDFIFPAYLNQDLGILYRKGVVKQENDWLRIFGPLQSQVYGLTFGVLLFIGCLLPVLDRTNTKSICKLHTSESLHYISNIMISMIGTITLQGDGLQPRTASSKTLVAFFWLFCVVVTGTYIGNLTAKLTETKVQQPFKSLDELVDLPGWTWGVGGELAAQIVKLHTGEAMQKMWKGLVRYNKTDPNIFTFNNTYQFQKILNTDENYAYLVLDAKNYAYNRMDCALELVDNVIPGIPIAIAVTKNSYLTTELDNFMGRMFYNGLLQKLDEHHYTDNRPLSCRGTQRKKEIIMTDMLGVVLVIGVGISFALIVLILENLYMRFNSRSEGIIVNSIIIYD